MRTWFYSFPSIKADQIVGASIIGVAFCFGLQTAEAQSTKPNRSPKTKGSDEVPVLTCSTKNVIYEASGFNFADRVEVGDCPGDETPVGRALIQPFCTNINVVIAADEGWKISELQFYHASTRPPEAGSNTSTSGTMSIDRATGKFTSTTTWASTTRPGAYQRWYTYGTCSKATVERKF